MISLKNTHRPLYRPAFNMGQTVTAGAPVAAPAVAPATNGVPKTAAVLTGLALTGLSAATAYVGINYGMQKKNTNVERALGWTVGVIGVLSGLVRIIGTSVLALSPSETTA